MASNYIIENTGEVTGTGRLLLENSTLTIKVPDALPLNREAAQNSYNISRLQIGGGTLDVQLDLTVGDLRWRAGTITGLGKTVTNQLLMDSSATKILSGHTLENAGRHSEFDVALAA